MQLKMCNSRRYQSLNEMNEKELKEIFGKLEEQGWMPMLCDAPVTGKRFRDYLAIALQMTKYLSE